MKKKLISIIVLAISLVNFAQIKYEKGYFIDNTNQKTDCLIKNIDWKDNPIEIIYKLQEKEVSKTKNLKSIKEFGVYNYSKYQRFIVQIDRSSSKISELTEVRTPLFKKENLFLKVLLEGEANLYRYEDSNLRRYFYKTEKKDLEQLVFKTFLDKNGDRLKNETYKQQLWNNLKCDKISMNNLQNVGYNKKDLTKLFLKYNQCNNAETTEYKIKEKRDLFNLSLRLGMQNSSLSIKNFVTNEAIDFDKEISLRFGIGVEFIMPFNKNKWAVFIEPTYQTYHTEKEFTDTTFPTIPVVRKYTVDYKTIEVPVGGRYYFFINNNSKIFIDAAYIIKINLGSSLEKNIGEDLIIKPTPNFAFSIGYNYKNKFSLALRKQTDGEILGDYLYWTSNYKSTSIIFGYTIF